MRSAAATYAPHGLRINCIAPGLVDATRQTHKFTDNEKVKVRRRGRGGQQKGLASRALRSSRLPFTQPPARWLRGCP